MEIKIAPSILSADFANLGQEVQAITNAGADLIHVDVMDGHFVPNITIGASVIKSIRKYSNLPFDVHLMISPVDKHIQFFAEAGADLITIHAESVTHLDRTINLIKSMGKKVGVSLVPSSHPNLLDYVIDEIDLILIMTVNPGFGGQSFISNQINKIRHVKKMINQTGKHIDLQVDGGINLNTAAQVIDAGANVLVAGSYIFKEGPEKYFDNIQSLKLITQK